MNNNSADTKSANNAVSYTRVNHGAVGDNDAVERLLERQRERCQQVAEKYGLVIVAEYSDNGGAVSVDHRPGLRRLLATLPFTRAHHVIVSDLARISRDVRLLNAVEEHLHSYGCRLLVYGEGPEHEEVRRRIGTVLANYESRLGRRKGV